MSLPTREDALRALRPVMDPELRRSIVELGMVRRIDIAADGQAFVTVSLTTPGCPIKSHFEQQVTAALMALPGIAAVDVGFDVLSDGERSSLQERLGRSSLPEGSLAQVGTVFCVASGKGGVGKSTLTANLAAALWREGNHVGVLDADVWGYSIPRMFGVNQRPAVSTERTIVPPLAHGAIKLMSIGFFVEEDSAVVWRGPMLHKALEQFLGDVAWGTLDYLVVDLPPGTGDVAMSLAEFLPQARFVIVTTPQLTAQKVARRAARMALKLDHEVVGVIENMAGYVDDTGRLHPIFGSGGGDALAEELDVPLLGRVPITIPLREHADGGTPLVLEQPEDPAALAIRAIAARLTALRPQQPFPLPMAEPPPPKGMSLPMV
ncbi:MAG TPA: Mrp/NBP35 family ATP-binding protein [Solirubrobacteraceae bacterium]|jgi:ATP-binding protein involved in chromosome partitioning|nr:Mrp/NBP35 family ATP-binding protein [Solirubrobacteraceae bacterium]